MRKQHRSGNAQAFRITGAREALQEAVRGQQCRYVISMTVRPCAVGDPRALLWNVERLQR